MTCTQPGCSGTIVDGYCDVCGAPAVDGSAAGQSGMSGTAAGTAAGAGTTGDRCAQTGCSGTIVDGYCDVCGAPAGVTIEAPESEPGPVSPGHPGESSSARIASAPIGSARVSAGSGVTRRVGSSRIRAARLGAGLTTVPPAPQIDPAQAVMTNPQVPQDRRFCAKCGKPVGRATGDRPGRPEGFCANCGTPYSFTAKLAAGELVAGQYLVVGALAHGGLGWIYAARDRNVSDRWVVLKGLLNSGDPDALAVAITEQRFLAQVEHPLIVEIYNFVTHNDAGYIVMEYVGGVSLKHVLKQRLAANGGTYDPLPVDQALAYIIEILPAFQYLHDLGLVYCDFKPDNLIQVTDSVKLIDLGGVRRIDDEDSAIYGTVGYQAPEVATAGPSIASDIYTIGRTLVVLCMEFRGYQGTYVDSLPDPASTPLFQRYDSLYWLVAKACAADPNDRFASAEELRAQCLGVLREVVAARTSDATLTSAASPHFFTPAVATSALTWDALPGLRPDHTDPGFDFVASLPPSDPEDRLKELEKAPVESAEVRLARCVERLRAGRPEGVAPQARKMLSSDPWDWRALWVTGVAALAQQDWDEAMASFNSVYHQIPGELAPKLALAVACESGGAPGVAEGLYRTCAQTDAAYLAPAAFGIARLRMAAGDTDQAVRAWEQVPTSSRGYGEARRLRARALLETAGTNLAALGQAYAAMDGIRLDATERENFNAEVLQRALAVVGDDDLSPQTVGPFPARPRELRAALENSYRVLAREATDASQRHALVDQANAVRPWSTT
ncbi:MAG: tetratricopeptide repeat protein [Nostocoides sp.]